jgi:hypothetical protein
MRIGLVKRVALKELLYVGSNRESVKGVVADFKVQCYLH